ncbi:hypothetical protein B842_02200 [Corynebacterium humireducens NBRC 106098 = DSM 45392]|uniref:DUF5319 domain-containing protein n=1 Tax=Corynebacterium humireducens NBRC 106098 = DSM 45392 TaxID=1223515 RepID=A0A0B5D7P8_9CORY|nr:DUF5319 domain-containing protein [Corynebacterium humireducens]AJE32293.1 hypothetical protein B842_02200 [Corynebacterium humireducens NBRC 106098 = DSM 45392]
MNYDSQMPLDPFADDPNDPASFLDPEEPAPPLTDEERLHITQDLALVARFREELTPHGILGIFFLCEDCDDLHYYDWDIMAANMAATLRGELAPVHEPSVEPDVNAYVPWDYAVGFLDGINAPR